MHATSYIEFSAEELNAARPLLLDKVVEYFLAKQGIEVLFVQGSVASDSTDEFSNIDFRVVVQAESVDGGEAKGE
ncbi:MAG: hypothetical protein KME57_08370 [Scytonema hyalinum WJT4-NPBG1]|jgi:hypothetical protein|nr:hypothetical protein [Scytonema hyalinum WJT4-NPBG1]